MLRNSAVAFASDVAAQTAHFNTFGYVAIRRSVKIDPALIQSLNNEVLHYAENTKTTWKYKFWRWMNSVSTAENRHSIPMPMTPLTQQVLLSTIGSIRPFLDSQLKAEAPMVELSSIITFPGAKTQLLHSDTPWAPNQALIVAALVALSPVRIPNGPTCVLEGSHTEEAHMKHALPTMPTFYSVDGEECPRIDPARTERKSLLKDIYATKTAILDVGDILLFNTNIFHYGSANTSTTSRALLCLAFQQPDEAKSTVESTAVEATPIDGFTYHTHMSMRARKWSLGSFPAT